MNKTRKPMATYNCPPRSSKIKAVIQVIKDWSMPLLVMILLVYVVILEMLPGILRFVIAFASWLLAVYEVLLG